MHAKWLLWNFRLNKKFFVQLLKKLMYFGR